MQINILVAVVKQSVGAFAPQAEDWIFESKPRETKAVRSAMGVTVTGRWR